MNRYLDPADSSKPYKDPTPLPEDVPKVKELGVTSAPLKSAAFFLGAYCKDYNGVSCLRVIHRECWPYCEVGIAGESVVFLGDKELTTCLSGHTEDFMLCKAENRDPAHCLKEGRRVTRCAQDLCVFPKSLYAPHTHGGRRGPVLSVLSFSSVKQDHQAARELPG